MKLGERVVPILTLDVELLCRSSLMLHCELMLYCEVNALQLTCRIHPSSSSRALIIAKPIRSAVSLPPRQVPKYQATGPRESAGTLRQSVADLPKILWIYCVVDDSVDDGRRPRCLLSDMHP